MFKKLVLKIKSIIKLVKKELKELFDIDEEDNTPNDRYPVW